MQNKSSMKTMTTLGGLARPMIATALLLPVWGSGCLHVSSTHAIQPILDAVNEANHKPARRASFSNSQRPTLHPLTTNAARVKLHLQKAGLYDLSAVKKIVASAETGRKATLNSHELKKLAKTVLQTLHTNTFAGSVRTNADLHEYATRLQTATNQAAREDHLTAEQKPGNLEVNVFTLLEGYYVAYAKGQFTLRDGTVLGKPNASLALTNGTLKGAIPNDTVDGIVTIFVEAVSDALFETPLYYAKTTNEAYVATYVPANTVLPAASATNYVQLFAKTNSVTMDFFLNGKRPTASRFLPCYQVVVAGKDNLKPVKGLTQKEVEFIQAVSGLSAKQSQALAGLIFRSFGGGAVGQFAFLHISVGNNQVLSSIVDNLMSSFSYHASERLLNEVFVNYEGGDPVVEALLDHYQDLLKIVGS
jgi:hypothetical protein